MHGPSVVPGARARSAQARHAARVERAQPVLLEREIEIDSIESWLADARAGVGRVGLALAGPGLGKSTLLGHAGTLARACSLQVLSARGGEIEREMPFGVARQLFEAAVHRLAVADQRSLFEGAAGRVRSLVSLGDAPKARGDPLGVIHGLYWLLSNFADRSPLLLAIDDLHWTDPQTARWLRYVGARIAELPALVLCAARPGEGDGQGLVSELAELPTADVFSLAPLSQSAVGDLLRRRLRREVDPEFVRVCVRTTGGNPFFVAELLRAAADDDLDPTAANVHLVPNLGTREIARSIVVRLGRLGHDARQLADAAAVLAGDATLGNAALLAGLQRDRALAAWDALIRGEILQPRQPLEFIHPIARSAIYREMTLGDRTREHRRAAAILHAHQAAADRVAAHALVCEPTGDQEVIHWLRTAAAEAMGAGAPDAAARYLRRATEEPPAPDLRAGVQFELGRALIGLDSGAAAAAFGAAAERMEGLRQLDALRLQAYALGFAGELEDAVGVYNRAIALAAEDTETVLQLTGRRDFFAAWWPADPDHARRRRDARQLARGLRGMTLGERQVLGAAAVSAIHDGAMAASEVLDLANRLNRSELDWLGREQDVTPGCLAAVTLVCDEPAAAALLEERAIPQCSAQGRAVEVSYAQAWLATARFRQGALLDAETKARTALEIITAAGEVAPVVHWAATSALTQVLLARGELAEAAGVLDAWTRRRWHPVVALFSWPELLRAELLVAEGHVAEGVQVLLAVGEWLERRGFTNPAYIPWRARTAPELAILGRGEEARALIDPAVVRARAFGSAWGLGMALRAAGTVEPGARGIELLREAIRVLEPSPCRLEHAHAHLELGAALRRANQRAAAREHLRVALDMAHRCGAEPLRLKAEQELAATGARPRRVLLTGVESLTASERRIAELAASGASNRDIAQQLFVTRKTVETHLGHAYQKLGISSRQQLAARLAADER